MSEVTGLVSGLSSAEVERRQREGAANDAPERGSRSVVAILRGNLLTRFNAIIGLMCALALTFGDPQDGLFGLVIVANAAIGTVQELRAKRTLDRLTLLNTAPVLVRRDGAEIEIAPPHVVRDDLILLHSGDRIVVDGVVVEAQALEVDESLLTGESDPIVKQPGDEMLSGSFVVAGSGAFAATKVGREAYAAQLVTEASAFSLAKSELLAGINRFLRYITYLIVPLSILVLISQLHSNRHFDQAIVGTVAGVVPMIPEGLVLLTSVAFAVGVIRLARRRCLVQELPAIEGLARVDILCLDKTGTLTEPGMEVAEVRAINDAVPYRAALAALVAADESPNPTMRAIAAASPGVDGWRAERVVPFSSARKWSGAAFADQGVWLLGAPDVLLAEGDPSRAAADEAAASGARVLCLASADSLGGRVLDGESSDEREPAGVRAAALVVLRQRLRATAGQTIDYFAEQGVAVKVVSGDNAVAVGAVAAQLGIAGADQVVDARELPESGEALGEALERYTVFGRVTPAQKRTFIAALQARGHTVAMTGDGVNDVLALKDADLGVAMGSGSPAARAVAKVVLLDDEFASLPAVVAEGRRVLGNIERVANLFLTKTVYSIALALLVGVLALPFPFLPRHITLIGALTIGIPAFFLALAPNVERARPGFVARVLRFAVPAGIATALATFAAYALAHDNPASSLSENRATATITLFAVAIVVLALVARPWTLWRLGLVAVMAGIFVLVLAVPPFAEFFALGFGYLFNTAVGLVLAAAAIGLLLLALRRDHWLGRD